MSLKHGISVTQPVSVWNRTIKTDFKKFFTSLTKATINGLGANFSGAADKAVDAISAFGLGDDWSGTAYLLIHRSLVHSVYTLVEENAAVLDREADDPAVRRRQLGLPEDDPEAITNHLDLALEESEMTIDESFFRQPRTLPVLESFKTPFRQWLEMFGLNEAEASSIVNRLPSYFVYALEEQWRTRPEDYAALKQALDTPFTRAGATEAAWRRYAARLRKQVDEPLFIEAFSLPQVYIPLRGYYQTKKTRDRMSRPEPYPVETEGDERIVVEVDAELDAWLADKSAEAVKIVSGGPGSGKSSLTKMFAARHAERGERRVLYVPLHLLELKSDLQDALSDYIRHLRLELTNPLSPDAQDAPYLLIFDGLDELSMQGREANELAQQFVREVSSKTERLNSHRGGALKVLMSGRELSVQTSAATEFKKPRQVIHVLPYFVAEDEREKYTDPRESLAEDQRQKWWALYGEASGRGFEGMPEELGREELTDITAQPLLNYLVALSHEHGAIDFEKEDNLNRIYRDLLSKVYERIWAGGRNPHVGDLEEETFLRWLEEIAVAAWHGDGRTTTVGEIKEYTDSIGAAGLLKMLREEADKGIMRLLTAFYFRRAGVRPSGDETFEFTHKSFSEYLTARRIVRLVSDVQEETERHHKDSGKGWKDEDALLRWIRVCGPSALDGDIFRFIHNEVRLYGEEVAARWQETLCRLISHELRQGLPMEQTSLPTFREQTRQARNAEESLIVVLSACARVTRKLSNIEWPERISFGDLISRVRGQATHQSALILKHLNYLNLKDAILISKELFEANLKEVNLVGGNLTGASLAWASLSGASLRRAKLTSTILALANLTGADLTGADLTLSRLGDANLNGANLSRSILYKAKLVGANLANVVLCEADIRSAKFRSANLSNAIFQNNRMNSDTDFSHAIISKGTQFESDEQREIIMRLAKVEDEEVQAEDEIEGAADE